MRRREEKRRKSKTKRKTEQLRSAHVRLTRTAAEHRKLIFIVCWLFTNCSFFSVCVGVWAPVPASVPSMKYEVVLGRRSAYIAIFIFLSARIISPDMSTWFVMSIAAALKRVCVCVCVSVQLCFLYFVLGIHCLHRCCVFHHHSFVSAISTSLAAMHFAYRRSRHSHTILFHSRKSNLSRLKI